MAKGRFSPYDAKVHPAMVRELAQQGLTNVEIAARLGFNPDTIYEWQKVHPEFSDALKQGKSRADDLVEGALFRRAMGYETTESEGVPFVNPETGQQEVRVEKVRRVHVPGNPSCLIFWLKNRRGSSWRDVHKFEHVFDRSDALEGVLSPEDEEAVEATVREVLGGGNGDGRSG